MDKKVNLHAGHRQRMRNKIDEIGFEKLPIHEQLEYFLFIVVPRANTNEIAHSLLTKFGSLTEVFNATEESLMQINGVGQKVAKFIKEIPMFSRAYYSINANEIKCIKSPADILKNFQPIMQMRDVEELSVLCLDSIGKVLSFKSLAKGSTEEVKFNPADLIKMVSTCKAKNIVLMHNHPFGEAFPSNEDVANTQRIYYALNSISVCMLDHYVFNSKGDWYSFLNAGMFKMFDDSFSGSNGFAPIEPKMNQFKRIDKIKNLH